MRIRDRAVVFALAGWLSALFGILTLPLVTLVLGPDEYGLFATGTAIAGLAGTVVAAPFPFVFAAARGDPNGLGKVRAVILKGACLSIGVVGVLALPAAFDPSDFERIVGLSTPLYFMAIVTIPAMPIWLAAVDLLTLEGRAFAYFVIALGQVLIGAAVTLTAVFGFGLHVEALFLGNLAGHTVTLAGAAFCLRGLLFGRISATDDRYFPLLAAGVPAQIADIGHGHIDRIWMASNRGTTELGLLAHAGTYQGFVLGVCKAISRSVWPATLDEARRNPADMPITRTSSAAIHFFIGAVGIGLAAIGHEAINLISNGKFGNSAPIAATLVAMLLIQHAGRNGLGVVFVRGLGEKLSRIAFIAGLIGIAISLSAIPSFGVAGVIAGIFARFAIYRVGLYRLTRGAGLRFQDGWIVAGLIAIALTWAVRKTLPHGVDMSIGLCIAALAIWTMAGARLLGELRQKTLRKERK